MLNRKIILGTLGCVSCIVISSQLFGGELTPYRLPSQENYPQPQSNQPIQRIPRQQSDRREEYYRDFERKAQGLPKGQRDKLIDAFSKNQQDALKKGDDDVAKHYFRLMEILSKENK